jgi:hypothetical protein
MIATAVRLKHRFHQGSSLSLPPGAIVYLISDCMIIAINLILAGELLSCRGSRCWLDSNNMQVIVIARLHAMYQRSRKMLISLFGISLTVQITCVVMSAVQYTGASGSKLPLCMALRAYDTNISGVHPVWYPFVQCQH